ncbi:hypothetical protein OUZ56_006186 [Daphnia magna]|uniref:Uncharacterized protein n=1 Tax=Daphnia magna TaxID=35525 RepID=A0ABQ9YV35_9CRUS|nr:hypothetical protein OUZ56_006186 [Daphnia magna]
MSYGTIQPYLDSRKHLKLQTGHTVTVIALHGQRIQISCSVVNLTSSGSYLEFREKDGDIAKQPVINRVYTSKSNTMAVYSQIVKDADWFNCKWKTTDSYPIHKLCRDTEAKTINGAIQSMDLAEESHRFCTFSIVVPLDQHVQISCSVVSLASGCGLKFHEERGWMNEAGLISTRPIIDRNYTSKGNKMVIQADSFDNKRCRFDCTWKTTTTPTYRLCFDKRAKSPNGTIQPLDDAGMDGPRFCPFTITAARTDQLIRISCSVVKLTTVLSSLRFYDGRDAGANVIAYPPIANKVYTSKGSDVLDGTI